MTLITGVSTAEEVVDANDLDVNIVFTNRYRASDYVLPNAGVTDIRFVLAAMLSGMLLFGAVYLLISRKRKT